MKANIRKIVHAAAILHPKLGALVRKLLGKGAALIPSSKKRGGPGAVLDIPLGHKDAAYVRSHFDGMEMQISDAPRADEIVVAVAVAIGGRPLPRIGGLKASEVKGEDGLRCSKGERHENSVEHCCGPRRVARGGKRPRSG